MVSYLIRLLLCGLAIFLIPNYLKGITVDSITTAIIVAFVMSLLNTFVRPILSIISIPITILTLGLFYFVISVILVYVCAYLVNGFAVSGIVAPLIFSFVLSVVNSVAGWFQK
jgi:putative membrane protein